MEMFDPNSITRIESGAPSVMHRIIGEAVAGEHYRADMRAYSWKEDVVSAGWSEAPQVIAFFGQHQHKARSAYCEHGTLKSDLTELGDIILIPPRQTLMSMCPAWDQRAVFFNLDTRLLPEFSAINWTPELLHRTLDIRSGKIRSIMSDVTREIIQPGFASGILFEGASMMLLAELYRMFGIEQCARKDSCAKLTGRQMADIEDRIRSDGPAPTLQQLADLCGMSRRNFSRLFKNTAGVTAGQFVAEKRMEYARFLLCEKQLLIKEIAHRCGFQNAAAFAGAFRRVTGYSPREYRRLAAGRSSHP